MGDAPGEQDDEFGAGGSLIKSRCSHPSSDGIDDNGDAATKVYRCLYCDALHLADGTRVSPPEVAERFETFWADIVCPGGEWDMEQVKEELHDYWTCLEQVPEVYVHVTGGRMSKPHYSSRDVISVHDENCPVVDDLVEDIRDTIRACSTDGERLEALGEILDNAESYGARERRRDAVRLAGTGGPPP